MLKLSEKEEYRLQILCELKEKRMKRQKAADCLKISIRQLDRIKASYSQNGLKGLMHKNRGRRSSHAMTEAKKKQIMRTVRTHYSDFKPTLASEKLLERHGISVSREKLRQMMMAEGLWLGKKRKNTRAYPRRTRRSRRGELVQGDASPHDWFEGRGPRCDLVSFVDDATGYVTARFEPSETTDAYFRLLHGYILEHGCPQALYVDKNSIFRINNRKTPGQGVTDFGVVLKDLNIELICAHSPQAKGRVERSYATFQDRVLKEMRLAGVNNIEEANEFLGWYLPIYNARFSKIPANQEDAHSPIPKHLNLYKTFTHRETRKLSKSLDFSYNGKLYQVVDCKEPRRMMKQAITVYTAMDGKMWVECRGVYLEIKLYEDVKMGPQTMDRKQLDAWLNKKPPMTVKQRLRRKIAYLQ